MEEWKLHLMAVLKEGSEDTLSIKVMGNALAREARTSQKGSLMAGHTP